MGVELYLYTMVLPAIGSFIPLYYLWNSYSEAKENLVLRIKLDAPVQISKPEPKEIKIFGKTIDYRGRYIFNFILLVLLLGIEGAIFLTALYFIWRYISKYLIKGKSSESVKPQKTLRAYLKPWLIILGALSLGPIFYGYFIFTMAQIKLNQLNIPIDVSNRILLAIGAALGLSCVAAGIVMAVTNKEAVRGIIQRPEIATWVVILSALAEGMALYGIVIAFMIIGQWGELGFADTSSLFAGGIAIGVACIGAAIGMSVTNKEAVKGMVERPAIATWYVIIAALAEGLALYGMVIAFMIIGKIGELSLAGSSILTASGITIGLAAIGAGIGIAVTMKKTSKAMITKPQLATWIVILAALAEGIALYGLVIAFMMVGKVYGHVSLASANLLYNSAFKFGGALILSGLLVGYLPTRIAISQGTRTWIKKIILAAIGQLIALIALVWEFMVIGRVKIYFS